MSSERNPKIHDLLKSYAKERRAEAGPPKAPDPAFRQRMLAEVEKAYGSKPAFNPGWAVWIANFWPRLALAGFGLLLIGLGITWFLPGKNPDPQLEMAQLPSDPLNQRLAALENQLQNPGGETAASPRAKQPITAPLDPGVVMPRGDQMLGDLERNLDPDGARPGLGAAQTAALSFQKMESIESPPSDAPPPNAAANEKPEQSQAETSSALLAENSSQPLALTPESLRKEIDSPPKLAMRNARSYELQIAPQQPLPDPAGPALAARSVAPSPARPENVRSSGAPADLTENASENRELSNEATLLFTQSDWRARYRQNFNSPPYPELLNSFEVQSAGNRIKIIDEDGSIYTGTVEPENSHVPSATLPMPAGITADSKPARPSRTREPAPTSTLVSSEPPASPTLSNNFSFRVQGNNVRLNEEVVITGNLLTVNSNLDDALTNSPTPALFFQNYLSKAQIEGQASIGGTNQLKIRALAEPGKP